MGESIVVVGAGVAGLAAALELSGRASVIILEARERLGGRIHTIRSHRGVPYELGAEFVHGKVPQLWRIIDEAGLSTHEVPDRHFRFSDGTLVELPDFWEQMGNVTEEIDPKQRDLSFAAFLSSVCKPAESMQLAKGFVESFHGATLSKASTQAIRLSEESSEEIDGQRQFRIDAGYDQIVNYLAEQCRKQGVQIRTDAPAMSINWSKRPVVVGLRDTEILADRVIVTVPIGMLKSKAIEFTPGPVAKLDAIHALEMSVLTKVILHFRRRFWPEANFGFIHAEDDWFDAWWADQRGDILTGWAAGRAGDELAGNDAAFTLNRALESLSKMFGETLPNLQHLLVEWHTHNWRNDPFSHGAYSFIPVNATDACQELARPENDVLFFAGEATALDYQFGTVHGALQSGFRAARDLRNAVPA